MASFNAPAPNNQIISDVNAIHELLGYLAQARPDRGTGYPEGSVRIVEYDKDNNLWAIQVYKDGTWDNVGRLYNNVRLLQGYAPSTSALAGYIPVYNASGQLVGNITGNAPTATKLATPRTIQVGGILSSTAQNFDGTANVTIPVNQITINNSADTAVNGTLTTAHGGTGRTDGAAQDVVFGSLAGNVLAKSVGNIGNLKHQGSQNSVDANTLTTTGNYMIHGSQNENWAANHWPINNLYHGWMRVGYSNGVLMHHNITPTSEWYRYSDNQAASWSGWIPISGNVGNITIYISKSGSDANTGIDSSYPVLTFARAFQIADKLVGGNTGAVVYLRIGAGEWGNVTISDKSYLLALYPYDGQAPTASSNSLPIFEGLALNTMRANIVGLLIHGTLMVTQNSYVYVGTGVKRIRNVYCSHQSWTQFASSTDATNILEVGASTGSSCIWVDSGGIVFLGTMHIKQIANITITSFLRISWGGTLMVGSDVVFDSTTLTFTGKKYIIDPSGCLITREYAYGIRPWLNTLPGTGGDVSSGAIINGMPYGAAQASNVVDLTSTQTISGAKTFSSPSITYSPYFDRSAASTSGQYCYHSFRDKNGKEIGRIQYTNTATKLQADFNLIYNDSVYNAILSIVREWTTAKRYLLGITPDADSNDTKVPTCEWVRARLGEVSGAKTVSQKAYLNFSTGTASQSGTWTITGCTPNQPLFVLHNHTSSVYVSGGVRLRVKSGGTGGANGGVMSDDTTTSWYLLGHNVENQSSTDVFIAIPSAATVLIDYAGMLPNRDSLVAYQ